MNRKLDILAIFMFLTGCAVKQPATIEETIKEVLPETTAIPIDYEAAANAATGQLPMAG